MEQTGRNESEPHQMSLETSGTGAKPNPSSLGEGRREQAGQQSAPAQTSGGVRVDSTSGSKTRVSWEDSGDGKEKSPESAQAGRASKADSRGWSGYFHFRNSTSVMGNLRRYSRDRLRRGLWCNDAGKG